jgi:pimeloyl-ACP methyl ester carboxylesterase
MRKLIVFPLAIAAACAPARTSAPVVPAGQCTHAVVTCQQWISVGRSPGRSLVYSSHRLDQPDRAVTRALVMIHGASRNPDDYFETATAAAFLAGALGNTVIISPRFASGDDSVAANELRWASRGNSWRSGGVATTDSSTTSFHFMDEIVKTLGNKKNFPNLTKIVIAGHSAGGQFATRYAMVNKVHGTLPGVTISYVVANPSSYAWPVALRPLRVGDADSATAANAALGADGEKVHTKYTFGPFDSTKAPSYNRWPAGLANLSGYAAGMNAEQLRKQLAERPTTYLLGQVDVLPLGGFDSSPNAMAQGPTRRARGEAFFKYVTEHLGAKHKAMIVSECGHNNRCVFTTDDVLPVIFP